MTKLPYDEQASDWNGREVRIPAESIGYTRYSVDAWLIACDVSQERSWRRRRRRRRIQFAVTLALFLVALAVALIVFL